MSDRTAVIIPAFNEAATILDIVTRTASLCALVVVVDDGSDDATRRILDGAPCNLLRNSTRIGKGASLWRGFTHAIEHEMDMIVTMDGDGQHNPEDIPRLISAAQENPSRIVIGTRLRNRQRMPPVRKFGNGMADFWISWAAGYRLRDTQSGLRLYPASVLRTLEIRHDPARGFVFESEILIEAAWQGWQALPVAVDCIYRHSQRASYFRPAHDTMKIIRMVASRLIRRGLYPVGLLRSLGMLATPPART
jgi:glycosyltransferase involved in cell wall biosynthesis